MTVLKSAEHIKQIPEFTRYNDLDHDSISIDFQIHTIWTDGENTPEELIRAAESIGLTKIAFTEHVRSTSTYFEAFYDEIDNLRANAKLAVYIGVEAKAVDEGNNIDVSTEVYGKAEIVLGSVHRINMNGTLIHLRTLKAEDAFKKEYLYSIAMIRNGRINVLSHPAGMCLSAFGNFPPKYMENIIASIAETNIAFELNSKYMTDQMLRKTIIYLEQYNPIVSLGSDVHTIDDLGRSFLMMEKILS